MKDKDFLAEADKTELEINPVSGADVEKLVKEVYATPPDIIAKAKEAAGRENNPAEAGEPVAVSFADQQPVRIVLERHARERRATAWRASRCASLKPQRRSRCHRAGYWKCNCGRRRWCRHAAARSDRRPCCRARRVPGVRRSAPRRCWRRALTAMASPIATRPWRTMTSGAIFQPSARSAVTVARQHRLARGAARRAPTVRRR